MLGESSTFWARAELRADLLVDGVDYEVIAGFAVVRSKSSNPGKSSWGGDLRV
jgi:hypothetical protein